MIKAARAVEKLQDIYSFPQPKTAVKMESMKLLYAKFSQLWDNLLSFRANLSIQILSLILLGCLFLTAETYFPTFQRCESES